MTTPAAKAADAALQRLIQIDEPWAGIVAERIAWAKTLAPGQAEPWLAFYAGWPFSEEGAAFYAWVLKTREEGPEAAGAWPKKRGAERA